MGGIAGAVVTAAVAVVVAALTQFSLWRMDHRNRVYERRRSALRELQEAALRVRGRLRDYGEATFAAGKELEKSSTVELTGTAAVTAARSDADALLEVHLARVTEAAVVAAVTDWRSKARRSFLGDEEVPDRDEEAAWVAMNSAVARALSVPGWWAEHAPGWWEKPPPRD